MQYNPRVTIMIPTYNQHQYIKQAVDSALAQDYTNIQIVVSDDSTNDKTSQILATYIADKKINYYHNKPRLGRVGNYYHTLRKYAKGDWILNLDGDDFLFNNQFVSKSIEIIKEHEEISMVFGREIKYDNETEVMSERGNGLVESQMIDGNNVFFNKRELGINFYHLSTLYNRKKAIEVGFYEDDCLGADTISLMKLLLGNKIFFLNEIGGVWRVHSQNDSFTEDIDLLIENIDCLYKLEEYLKQKNYSISSIDSWIKKTVLNRIEIYLIQFLQQRKFALAYTLLVKFKKKYRRLFYLLFTPKKTMKLLTVGISPKIYARLSK